MTEYHAKKSLAIVRAHEIENMLGVDFTSVEFEPGKGFIVIAYPTVVDISHISHIAECRHPNGHRLLYGSGRVVAKPAKPANTKPPVAKDRT